MENNAKTINSWNWGPLVFTFTWAMVHELWLFAILSILPGLSLIIGIILSIYGNELAWKKNSSQDYAIFIEQQRKWNKAGLIFVIGCGIIITLLFGTMLCLLCFGSVDKSYSFKL